MTKISRYFSPIVGLLVVFFKNNTKEPSVRYFMDRGPNFIASCLNKLRHYFYDSPWRPSCSLPKKENRTAENIAEAALQLADLFFQKKHSYTYEKLLEMARDTKALEIYPGDRSKRPKRRSEIKLGTIQTHSIPCIFWYCKTSLLIHTGIYFVEETNFINSWGDSFFFMVSMVSEVACSLPRYHIAEIAKPIFEPDKGIFLLLICFRVTSRLLILNRLDCPDVRKIGCAGT